MALLVAVGMPWANMLLGLLRASFTAADDLLEYRELRLLASADFRGSLLSRTLGEGGRTSGLGCFRGCFDDIECKRS